MIDAAVALVVFVYNFPVQGAYVPPGLPTISGILVSVGLCAPFVVRRDVPVGSFGAVLGVFALQLAFGVGPMPANVMLFLGLYTVAAYRPRRVSVVAAAALAVGAVVAAVRWGDGLASWVELATVGVFIVSVWMWGSMIGIRRAYVATLQERAVQLERERDDQQRIAAAAERARIARVGG